MNDDWNQLVVPLISKDAVDRFHERLRRQIKSRPDRANSYCAATSVATLLRLMCAFSGPPFDGFAPFRQRLQPAVRPA
jgi:hypothetical protein